MKNSIDNKKSSKDKKLITREEALKKMGKFAAYTAPAMMILLARNKKTYAGSPAGDKVPGH